MSSVYSPSSVTTKSRKNQFENSQKVQLLLSKLKNFYSKVDSEGTGFIDSTVFVEVLKLHTF